MSTKIDAVHVCTIEDVGMRLTGEDAGEFIDAINKYLAIFARPTKPTADIESSSLVGNKCLKCDATLNGMFGSFRWGMAHGEGTCSRCGWPCRAYHGPKLGDDDIFDRPMKIVLQYHPKYVTENNPDDGDEG